MKTRTFLLILLLLALGLSACAAATPEATATATVAPTRTAQPRLYVINPPEPTLPAKQQVFYEGYDSLIQGERIQGWLDYWIKCDNPPFDVMKYLYWGMVFDDPENPTESLVVIDSGGALYATPVSNGEWLEPPTTPCQGSLDSLYTPLLVATEEEREWLRVRGGKLVRVDAEGQVVAEVDLQGLPSSEDMVTQAEIVLDMGKLENFPESTWYLSKHAEEFQRAPDPLSDIDGFNTWWNESLIPALGALEDREINFTTVTFESFEDWDAVDFNTGFGAANPIRGAKFFYFTHHGTIYPVPVISVAYPGEQTPFITAAVILFNGFGAPEGTGVIEAIANGANVRHISIYKNQDTPSDPIVRQFLGAGMDRYIFNLFSIENRAAIGIGRILTLDE
jgi:hypothetical protein